MAGTIGLLSGNDFDENLLKYVGDKYGITAVNGIVDLSNKTKDILNRESFNIAGNKDKDKDEENQWWDFLDLFPNSQSNNRGSGSTSSTSSTGGSGSGAKVGNDLFSTISGGEGGINSYNTGTAQVQGIHHQN